MFDFSKIKMSPAYSKNFGSGATEEQIIELEKYCGYTLPDSYKFILKNYNGGEPETKELCVFDEEMGVTVAYGLQEFYVVDEHKELPINIWQAIEKYSSLIGPGALPFAEDGYNCVYYFKYIQNVAQVWCLAFMEDEEPENFLLFNSFDELLGALCNEN